jgi:hypothetical protein
MIGTQLHAPNGYRNLECGCVYHFLENNAATGRVTLVQFWVPDADVPPAVVKEVRPEPRKKRRAQPRALLVRMACSLFEAGLLSDHIRMCEVQHNLPPWFRGVSVDHLCSSDRRNPRLVRSHSERISLRFEIIKPAVARADEILACDDPMYELGKLARACCPAINETRYALWFLVYLAFGRKPYVLHYAIASMGRWDRLATPGAKRGTPNLTYGAGHGHNADEEMVRKIRASYATFGKRGVRSKTVYRLAMTKEFGCEERKVGARKEFYHPDGAPFPTAGMYWYHVRRLLGKKLVRRVRIGPRKDRSFYAPYTGFFSADTANLMERVESDGFIMEEVPRALVGDADVKPLVVVRIRDVRSGLFTGIGFANVAERASAYRMAKFVQAVDKAWLCSLFGIVIQPEQWPNRGSSPYEVQDRGPGATPGAFSSLEEFKPVIVEGTPSRSPQSKALIEASNPRSIKIDDTVHYMRSDKNVFQLCVQEIMALIVANDTMDVSDRVPNDLLEEVEVPTPLQLWNALDARMRNCAVPMTKDEAIVAFLTPVTARLTRRGVELLGRVFGSDELDASGVRDKLSGNQNLEVQAYVLEACVRHIWIQIHGSIIQVDMMVAYRTGEDEVYVSLSDMMERAAQITRKKRGFEEHKVASEAEVAREYEKQTGQKWRSAKPRAGRPKFGSAHGKADSKLTQEIMKGKKG